MLIPQNIKVSKAFSGLAPLASGALTLAILLLMLVVACIVWIGATVLVVFPLASLFPHAETSVSAILFGVLFLPIGFGVVWLMLHCGPWYDTAVVILWIAFQGYGSQGHPWPPFVIGMTLLLVAWAVLRWVQYVRERRLPADPNNPT